LSDVHNIVSWHAIVEIPPHLADELVYNFRAFIRQWLRYNAIHAHVDNLLALYVLAAYNPLDPSRPFPRKIAEGPDTLPIMGRAGRGLGFARISLNTIVLE
jgi:hypothetical protein